ncbi:MAG: GIY-YIG nuclease family protein [Candidatus Binataceae bacterium]
MTATMARPRQYFVYIIASRTKALYIGVTNDLERRIQEHKSGAIAGFTARYRINRLIYFEEFQDVRDAIAREKQLKAWRREKKVKLIEAANPKWLDLTTLN